jgi:uncharacterized protein YecE (DUF72 family)
VYVKDVDPGVADQAWEQFLAALAPLRQAGKLGALLFQFPPWFPISRRKKDYILGCAQRAAPDRVCVEFRNHIWMTEDNQTETLGLLADCRLPYVCVEMPRATGTLPRTPRDRASGQTECDDLCLRTSMEAAASGRT